MTTAQLDRGGITTPGLPAALCYLRVSTKEQAEMGGEAEGYSIPAQRAACMRKVEGLGGVVVQEFVDAGESARSASRPALQQMLKYVQEHPIKYVVVHKLDRLARNRFDDVEINLVLQQAGVTLVSCSENIDETPSGALMHGIMSSIAEFYSRNLASEAIKGMTQKAMVGGTPTKAPIGYRNIRKLVDGREIATVEVDQERGPLITWAFLAYATGEWTVLSLIEELTVRGLTTLPTRKRIAKPLSPSSLHRVLRNPYYIGVIQWKGIHYEGIHEPLIDPDTFRQVQAMLDAKNTAGERESTHPHYLKGSVFCDACGSRFGITMAKGRGGLYPYFMCLGRHRRRTGCTQRSLRIEFVEASVEQEWQGLRLEENYAELLKELFHDELANRHQDNERQAAVSSRRRQVLTEERAKLLRAHYEGAVPLDLLKSEMERITTEIEQLERRLQRVSEQHQASEDVLIRCISLTTNLAQLYSQADDGLRRQLNQAIFSGVYFKDEYQTRYELAEPFKTLFSPDLVIDTSTTQSGSSDWDNRGLPTWLLHHDWWASRSTHRVRSNRACSRSATSSGLGLNSVLLAPPTGFEPVLPP